MLDIQTLPAFQREQEAIRAHRRAVRLAEGLLLALQLKPNDRELVVWLAGADRRDNHDALVAWVIQQLQDPSLDPGAPELSILMERLTRHLNEITDDIASI